MIENEIIAEFCPHAMHVADDDFYRDHPMPTMADEQKRRVNSIRDTADRLTELARRYDRLRWMAENDASGEFLRLADAAGKMTEASLSQLATLLELVFNAQAKMESDSK